MKGIKITIILAGILMAIIFMPQSKIQAFNDSKNNAEQSNFANIVVFVNFADTTHEHTKSYFGKCFLEDPKITEMFDGNSSYPRALKQYLYNISYGQFNLKNIFPQYDEQNNKIIPYTLCNNVSYYSDGISGDAKVIKEISDILLSSNQIGKDQIVDYNNDGCVDNLTIVVSCDDDNVNRTFVGHKSTYAGSEEINGKKIAAYNIIPEGDAYFGLSKSGVIVHEFMHSLGYPDLYVGDTTKGSNPVSYWDIMAAESMYLQYPLAYYRSTYSGWFNIPTITESVEGYAIYSASASSYETKDNQAVILKTDYSSTEFFVIEYRQQGQKYSETDYDCKIPGSGLIIYRINTSVNGGNMVAPPYQSYVFRPGDTYESGFEKASYDNFNQSFLSSESGRTSYGTHDLSLGLEDNAITYSDGTNSGIVIENVGSASGDKITFDISFSESADYESWNKVTEDNISKEFQVISSCVDYQGNIYYLTQTNKFDASPMEIYQYKNEKWNKILDGPTGISPKIAINNNGIYISYLDESYRVRVDRWNEKVWENIFVSEGCSNGIYMINDLSNIYIAYSDVDGNAIYAYQFNEDGIVKYLSNQVCLSSGKYPSNPTVEVFKDQIYVSYREAFNNNELHVKTYIENMGWTDIFDGTMQANSAYLKANGDKLYLVKNGTIFGNNNSYMYEIECSNNVYSLRQIGNGLLLNSNVNEMDICFYGESDIPCIIYNDGSGSTLALTLLDNEWVQMGNKISIQEVYDIKLYYNDGYIYATYLDIQTGNIQLKSYKINEEIVEDNYIGIREVNGEFYYYNKGKIDYSYTNIIQNGSEWLYVENGKVNLEYSGIRQNENGWWRIENGKVNFGFTGLASNENGRFYIQDGRVNFDYTDIIQDGEDWVYVENSEVRYDYTGIRENVNGWWRIENGKVNFGFTGIASNENGRFYIQDGRVNFDYTDIIQDGADWVYVENSEVRYDYTGIRENINGWWRIENGKVNFGFTGIASNENGEFYIKDGNVRFDYNGLYQYKKITYIICNGLVIDKLV